MTYSHIATRNHHCISVFVTHSPPYLHTPNPSTRYFLFVSHHTASPFLVKHFSNIKNIKCLNYLIADSWCSYVIDWKNKVIKYFLQNLYLRFVWTSHVYNICTSCSRRLYAFLSFHNVILPLFSSSYTFSMSFVTTSLACILRQIIYNKLLSLVSVDTNIPGHTIYSFLKSLLNFVIFKSTLVGAALYACARWED